MTQPTHPAPATCYRHPDRATYIRCVRCDRSICPECMRPASVGFQCPEEGSAPRVRTMQDGSSFLAVARTAPVTSALIVANLVVFVIFVIGGSGFASSTIGSLESHTVQFSPSIASGQWYRILTAMFSHFGILHVGSNMFVLYVIGIPLERQIGRVRYAAIYLVAGIGGGVATYLFVNAHTVSGGASGAIFGLLGAYAVIARRLGSAQLGPILSTIVFNLVITFAIPGISITDHIGGLVVGAILGAVLALDARGAVRSSARARRVLVEAVAFVVVLLVLVGVFAVRTHQLRERPFYGASAAVSAPRSAAVPSAAVPPPAG
jgi:membrane associated rhomboid family serine protease